MEDALRGVWLLSRLEIWIAAPLTAASFNFQANLQYEKKLDRAFVEKAEGQDRKNKLIILFFFLKVP